MSLLRSDLKSLVVVVGKVKSSTREDLFETVFFTDSVGLEEIVSFTDGSAG